MQWANEIAGVGGVEVAPLWKGPGTVGLYLIDTDKRAASQDIVNAVQQYMTRPRMDRAKALPGWSGYHGDACGGVAIDISVKVRVRRSCLRRWAKSGS